MIADDHPIICVALGEILHATLPGVHVESVANSDELLESADLGQVDLLIVDLEMPGRLQSIPLLEAIATSHPDLKVMVYTGHAQPSLALASLELGVSAYVLKSSGLGVALDAVRLVGKGQTFMDPSIDMEDARLHPWNQLTEGERQVLLALARGKTLQAIAIDSGRSYKTVTTHKYNALHKLGLRSKAEIGSYLAESGLDYLLVPDA